MKVGILVWIACIAVVLTIGAMIAVRFWPLDLTTFETDAFDASAPETPNYYLSSDEEGHFSVSVGELSAAIAGVILSTQRTKQISISADKLSQTYVSRSALFGFPDFTSVSIKENADGTSNMKIYSRARFGYSDMGVNKRRVLNWLADVRTQTGT